MTITDQLLAEYEHEGIPVRQAVEIQNELEEQLRRERGTSLEQAALVVGALGSVVTTLQPITAPVHYNLIEISAEAHSAPINHPPLQHHLPTQKSAPGTVLSHQHDLVASHAVDPSSPKPGMNPAVITEIPVNGDTVDAMEARLGVTNEATAVKLFDRENHTDNANLIYAGKKVELVDRLRQPNTPKVSSGAAVITEIPVNGDTVDAMEARLGVTNEATAVKLFDRENHTDNANLIYAGKAVELVDSLQPATAAAIPKTRTPNIVSGQPAPPPAATAKKVAHGNVAAITQPKLPSRYVGLEAAVERLAQTPNESLSHQPATPARAANLSKPRTPTLSPKVPTEIAQPVKAQTTRPKESYPDTTSTTVPSDKLVAGPNKDTSLSLQEPAMSKESDQTITTLDQPNTASANRPKVHSRTQAAQASPVAVSPKPSAAITATTYPLYPPPTVAPTQTTSEVTVASTAEQVPETTLPATLQATSAPASAAANLAPLAEKPVAASPILENSAAAMTIESAAQAVASTVENGLLNLKNGHTYSAAEFRRQEANSNPSAEPVIFKDYDRVVTAQDQPSTANVNPITQTTPSMHHKTDNSLSTSDTPKHEQATQPEEASSYPHTETIMGTTGSERVEALRLFEPETSTTAVTHPDVVSTDPAAKTDYKTNKPQVEAIIMNDLDAIEQAFRSARASAAEAEHHGKASHEADHISPPATQQAISQVDRVEFQKVGDNTRDEEGSNADQVKSSDTAINNTPSDLKPSTEGGSSATHPIPDNLKVPTETVTLKPGESTWYIASKFSAASGVPLASEVIAIEKANDIKNNAETHHLAVGDQIEVPLLGPASTIYRKLVTFKTLPQVAHMYGMTAAELLEMNPELAHVDTSTKPQTKLTLNVPKVNLLEQTAMIGNNSLNNETNGTSIATSYNGYEFFPVPQEYMQLIIDAAEKFQPVTPILSPAFLAAILNTESHFNPNALSGAGAEGIAQFEPPTFKGEEISANESPFVPSDAIYAEANLLAGLINSIQQSTGINNTQELFELASAGYNAGINAVRKYNWTIPPYTQTQDYVGRVTAAIPFYQQQFNQYLAENTTPAPDVNLKTIPGNVNAVYGPANVKFYSQWGNQNGNWGWGGTSYSQYDSCAPTTEASIITTLTGHTVTPPELAEWNYLHGQHDPSEGTEWSSFVESMQPYGLNSQKLDNLSEAAAVIRDGGMVIVSGDGADPFTPDGHVLALRGIDRQGNFLVMNPNSGPSYPGDPNDNYSAAQLEAAISPDDSNGMAIFAITKPSSKTAAPTPTVTTTTVAPPVVPTTTPPLPPVTTPITAVPTTIEPVPPVPSTNLAPPPIVTSTTNSTLPPAVSTTVTIPPTTVEPAAPVTTVPVSVTNNTSPAANPSSSSTTQ